MNVEKARQLAKDAIRSFHESVFKERHSHFISIGIGFVVLLTVLLTVLNQKPKTEKGRQEETSYLLLQVGLPFLLYLAYTISVVLILQFGKHKEERREHMQKGLEDSIYDHRKSFLVSVVVALLSSSAFLVYTKLTEKKTQETGSEEELLSKVSLEKEQLTLILSLIYSSYVLAVIYKKQKETN